MDHYLSKPMIEHHNENDISKTDDAALMKLLQLCFPTLPQFKTGRYWLVPCNYRWIIRDKEKIIANAAVIDKTFLSDGRKISIAGIAYVCTHPEYRRKGLVKQVLAEIHRWAKEQQSGDNYSFSFLFGKNEIYKSSGYIKCKNEFRFTNRKNYVVETKQIETAHYFPLGNESWPESLIDIQGAQF
jgi:hypothetical protein